MSVFHPAFQGRLLRYGGCVADRTAPLGVPGAFRPGSSAPGELVRGSCDPLPDPAFRALDDTIIVNPLGAIERAKAEIAKLNADSGARFSIGRAEPSGTLITCEWPQSGSG